MIDHRITPVETIPTGVAPNESPAPPTESLEQRLSRLENAIATLQDTRCLEERVAERVADRIERTTENSRMSSANGETAPRIAADKVHGLNDHSVVPAAVPIAAARSKLLLIDTYQDLRAMVRMSFDRRYHVSWTAKVIPVTALVLMLLSWVTIGSIPFVGWLLDKAVDIVLAFVAYKVLCREAGRYRAVS
jgi:hypothetical protein